MRFHIYLFTGVTFCRSSSLTAPNGPSQQEAIRSALRFGDVSPAQVNNLQMHGTGTPLGDPIEVGAANAVLVDHSSRDSYLSASTAKAWIGHTEAAAGATGLYHATVASSMLLTQGIPHLGAMNPHIQTILDMQARKSRERFWVAPRTCSLSAVSKEHMVGISSFAFQGTNAHALVKQVSENGTLSSGVNVPWKKSRVWIAPHPFVLAAQSVSMVLRGLAIGFEAGLASVRSSFIMDHTIKGLRIAPASFFLELTSVGAMLMRNEKEVPTLGNSGLFSTPLLLNQSSEKSPTVCLVKTLGPFGVFHSYSLCFHTGEDNDQSKNRCH